MTEKRPKKIINKETRIKQKENLKTLVENSSVSKLRSTGRVMKYGAASFKRNIWLSLAAILVMTVTLIILLVTAGASLILNSMADDMRERIDITVYFQPGTSLEVLDNMADMIKTDDNVKSVEVSDSAMEYQAYLEENQDQTDLMEVLDDPTMSEIMLNSMQSVMRIKVHNPERIDNLKHVVETTEIFQENIDPDKKPTYDENREAIASISSWANIAKNGGLIVGAVFLVISILMIFNTIRMAIFSRREEIYMMKLVGADTSFIRGPFIVEAQICGVISGLVASTTAYIGYILLAPKFIAKGVNVNAIVDIMGTNQLVLVYLSVIGIGMIISYISARLAMQKYLK